MRGNPSYFYLWGNSSCYAAGNLSCYARKLKLLLSVEKLRLVCSRKLYLQCAETQVTSICGETPVAMHQETWAAMRGNSSYFYLCRNSSCYAAGNLSFFARKLKFYLWRNSNCYASGNLSCYARKLKLLQYVEKLRLVCSRKLELLCAETQVTFICGETPIVMEQETWAQVTSIGGETPVAMQQETWAAMRGNSSCNGGEEPCLEFAPRKV